MKASQENIPLSYPFLLPTFPFGSYVRVKPENKPRKKNNTIKVTSCDYLTVVSTHFVSIPQKNKAKEIITVGLRTTCCSPLNRFFSLAASSVEIDDESRPQGCGKHLAVAGDFLMLNQTSSRTLQNYQQQYTHGVVLWSNPRKTTVLLPDIGTLSIPTDELKERTPQHQRKWVEKVSEGDFVRPVRNHSRLFESWSGDIRRKNGEMSGWSFGFVSSRTRVRSTLQGKTEWRWWYEVVVMEGEAKGGTLCLPEEMAMHSYLSEELF